MVFELFCCYLLEMARGDRCEAWRRRKIEMIYRYSLVEGVFDRWNWEGKMDGLEKRQETRKTSVTVTLTLLLTSVYCSCLSLASTIRAQTFRDKNEQGFCMCVFDALSFLFMTQPPGLFSLFAISFRLFPVAWSSSIAQHSVPRRHLDQKREEATFDPYFTFFFLFSARLSLLRPVSLR